VLARPRLSSLIGLVLRHVGIEATVTASPARARLLLRQREPALLVADIGRGPFAARLLESARSGRATLALVDLDRGKSSLTALGGGADDVMRVPFTPDELAVRTAQVLQRVGVPTSMVRNVEVGGLELSLDEYAHVGSRTVRLSAGDNSLLYLLVANAGRRVARADIRDLSWGVEHAAPVEAVDAAVARLERTLGAVDVLRIERVDDAVVARLPALRMRSLHDARRRPAKN